MFSLSHSFFLLKVICLGLPNMRWFVCDMNTVSLDTSSDILLLYYSARCRTMTCMPVTMNTKGISRTSTSVFGQYGFDAFCTVRSGSNLGLNPIVPASTLHQKIPLPRNGMSTIMSLCHHALQWANCLDREYLHGVIFYFGQTTSHAYHHNDLCLCFFWV